MKTKRSKASPQAKKLQADELIARAAATERLMKAARRHWRTLKMEQRQARKAFKQAKKAAKLARKEAVPALKALKKAVKKNNSTKKLKIQTKAVAEPQRPIRTRPNRTATFNVPSAQEVGLVVPAPLLEGGELRPAVNT